MKSGKEENSMIYEKPQILVSKNDPANEIMCGCGNQCNGPKDANKQ